MPTDYEKQPIVVKKEPLPPTDHHVIGTASNDDDQPKIQFYTEVEREFETIVRTVDQSEQVATSIYIGSFDGVVGRNQTPAVKLNKYNRWRTVMPFMGSLSNYVSTGSSFSPGNVWVENFEHNPNNTNPDHFDIPLTYDQSAEFVEVIRGLFPWTEVQHAAPEFVMIKRMGIVDHENGKTYLIRLQYNRTNETDNIRVVVGCYGFAVPAVKMEPRWFIEAFARLQIV